MGTACSKAPEGTVYVAEGGPAAGAGNASQSAPAPGSESAPAGPRGMPSGADAAGAETEAGAAATSTFQGTVSLQQLLTEGSSCKALEAFALRQPALNGGIKPLSYLLLWLDVADLRLFPHSDIRNDRIHKIYQRYIQFGARHRVALPFLVTEDVKHSLQSEPIPDTVFDAAQNEAFDFVEAELYPRFMRDTGPLGYVESCVRMPGEKKQTLLRAMTTQDIDAGGTLQEKRLQLESILDHPVGRKAFRAFIKERHSEENLAFWLAVSDFEVMYADLFPLDLTDPAVQRRCHYFVTRATKVYDQFIKFGANQQVNLSHKLLNQVVEGLKKEASALSMTIFRPAQDEIFNLMVANYLDPFTKSPHYAALQTALQERDLERRQTAAEAAAQQNVEAHPDLTGVGTVTLDLLLSGPGLSAFKLFLEASSSPNKSALLFWEEVNNYKAIPASQTSYLTGRAQRIFEKYLERGAPLEVGLPPQDRVALMRLLDTPTVHMFDGAQAHVYDRLHAEEWPVFRGQPEFAAITAAAEQRRVSVPNRHEVTDDDFEVILNSEPHCRYFKEFVESEFCAESLLFWLEVSDVRRMPASDLMQASIRKVYRKFVRPSALQAVSISPEARAAVDAAMAEAKPSRNTFEEAQMEVFTFMKEELFPKFIDSELCQRMLADLGGVPRTGDGESHAHEEEATSSNSPAELSLHQVLDTSDGARFFKDFCVKTLCEENFMFWADVEDFKQIPGDDYMRVRAKKIAIKYINPDSRMQVNISNKVQKEILANVDTNPSRSLFQKAHNEVFQLMQRDTFRKFLVSEEFQTFKRVTAAANPSPFNRVQNFTRKLTKVGSGFGQ